MNEKKSIKQELKELLIEMLSSGEMKISTSVENKELNRKAIVVTTRVSVDNEVVCISSEENPFFHTLEWRD